MRKNCSKKSVYKHLQGSLVYFVLFILIFLYAVTSINISMLRKFHLFADITAQDLLSLINEQRIKNGVPPLIDNPKLDEVSYLKGQDMVSNNYFAHYSPQGNSPWYWFDQAGYYYQYAGENLAIDFTDAKTAVDAWMNSLSHRENILNKHYTETGIAIIQAKTQENKDRIILVQTFGKQFDNIATIKLPITEKEKVIDSPDITTTTTYITNTSLATKVLGLAQIKIGDKISTAEIRTKDEAQKDLEEVLITGQDKTKMNNTELERVSLSNEVLASDRIKYFSTAFFNSKFTKIINSFSGLSLIFIGVIKTVIIKTKKSKKLN